MSFIHHRFFQLVLAAILIAILCLSLPIDPRQFFVCDDFSLCRFVHFDGSREHAAKNRTLGFQDILALSKGTSWRVQGLQAAANFSDIDMRIPYQPYISPESVDAFMHLGGDEHAHPRTGSAVAWIAHLNLLRFVVQEDYESVLILEDDVDWDVRIKQQMLDLARAMRNYTSVPEDVTAPYGLDWDVLWIGHCNEVINNDTRPFTWPDPTRVPTPEYITFVEGEVEKLTEGHRSIFATSLPYCTFAYAVTRDGARRILEHGSTGRGHAYDLWLSLACSSGALRCISVFPELMHQFRPDEGYGQSSLVNEVSDGKDVLHEEDVLEVLGTTNNIVNSTRCEALFHATCLGTGPP